MVHFHESFETVLGYDVDVGVSVFMRVLFSEILDQIILQFGEPRAVEQILARFSVEWVLLHAVQDETIGIGGICLELFEMLLIERVRTTFISWLFFPHFYILSEPFDIFHQCFYAEIIVERLPARQHDVSDDTDGPDVDFGVIIVLIVLVIIVIFGVQFLVNALETNDLRCHIVQCTDLLLETDWIVIRYWLIGIRSLHHEIGMPLEYLGGTEIDQFDHWHVVLVIREQDVLRFQVSVHDADLFVAILQASWLVHVKHGGH